MLSSISSIDSIEDHSSASHSFNVFTDVASIIVVCINIAQLEIRSILNQIHEKGIYPTIVIWIVNAETTLDSTDASISLTGDTLNVSFSRMIESDNQPSKSDIRLPEFSRTQLKPSSSTLQLSL